MPASAGVFAIVAINCLYNYLSICPLPQLFFSLFLILLFPPLLHDLKAAQTTGQRNVENTTEYNRKFCEAVQLQLKSTLTRYNCRVHITQ